MAQQKIQAGKLIDTVTKPEMEEALSRHFRSWMAELMQGGRFVRTSFSGVIDGSGNVSFGGSIGNDPAGPTPGMVWDVRAITVSGITDDTDELRVYVNDAAGANAVTTLTKVTGSAGYKIDQGTLVLYPGETILFNATGLASTGSLIAAVRVTELPIGLAWKLI